MRCVVTGGAGFIGSSICSVLEARNVGGVAVVDELRGDQWMNIAKRSLHAIIAPRDIWNYLKACPAETAVIHMGARSSAAETDGTALAEVNIKLTVDLFDHCAERGWPFIYASSASVYGVGANQSDDDALLHQHRPLTAYAWSKLLTDRMIIGRDKAPPFWAGLRLFNVYGPGETHKGDQRSFVSKCLDAIRDKTVIRLFRGSEEFRRDWVYVGDVAQVVDDFLTLWELGVSHPGRCGIYNVGSGEAVSFADVASICIEASGRIAPITTVPFPDHLHGHYQAHTRADTSKLARLMPDFKFKPLRDGAPLAWRYAQRDGLSRFP